MRPNNRRGALLLMLLIALVGIGLFSLKAVPDQQVITLREKEQTLSQTLSIIRSGMALERTASESALFYGDFEDQAKLVAYLNDLVARGYLAKVPKDPFCPDHLWGTGPGCKFWVPTRNLLASSSFETGSFAETPWHVNETNVIININDNEWPGRNQSNYDSFPYQNCLGTPMMGFSGMSLAITQK